MQTGLLKRREFITLLGGAAVSWPLAARAQQGERLRSIGVLMAFAEDDPEAKARLAAFRQGLEKRGWSEGRDVRFDARHPALQRESRTIPIVFAVVADPNGSGFIDSLPRPRGNITGVAQYEAS